MKNKLFIAVILGCVFTSCEKYLDQKSSKALVIPTTVKDLQALLDNNAAINIGQSLMEYVSDNYYITTADWQSAPDNERGNYRWDGGAIPVDNCWSVPYSGDIYYSNFVLDALPTITYDISEQSSYNAVKGSALFIRALTFFQLAQVYCKAYSSSATTDMGIVLRLSAAIEPRSTRATVKQTYDQILNDLKTAANLLPDNSVYSTRPNKPAAFGALARVYLSMRDYPNALAYADSFLVRRNTLLDYNTLLPPASTPFPSFINNSEIIYLNRISALSRIHPDYAKIDSNLYNSYAANDLRKQLFFVTQSGPGTFGWRGSYDSRSRVSIFNGIATDEMYLTRAECYARSGNVITAMADLNALLRKRWKTNTYTDMTAIDATDAKNKILQERRKELIMRGLRWTDVRRLNLEGANIAFTRLINGVTYTLPPNDLRWVLLIPDVEIVRSGIPQNPR